MNDQNVDYLKERIFFLGFGDKLNAELEKNIKAQKEQFQLPIQAEFSKGEKKAVVDFALDFTKSKQNDMYFLNNYKATLKNDDPEKERSQTFYINKGNGVTAKEAYNLLEGRAVHKKLTNRDGDPYEAWLQLNSKKEENGNHKVQQFHSAWGFDLDKNVSKIPMKEMESPEQKEKLIKSLEKGNLQAVTLNLAGKEEKAFIEANPRDRNIIIYDANMIKQNQGIREHKGESQGKQQTEKKEAKSESASKDQKAEPDAEKRTRGRKMSV